ncbi:MAG: nickel pincer cofactor biosynthesis protein LarC [Faecalicatena sp.]|uniref:nickel pincer cofactor biosynthesis protein LarC n=1 Tax=Faecalicatena sp. TaxID=2005360 RepID=UPI00258E5698|nr:nickel pincer cofactor biosynthesis protein LarC [Faecalicatena sp.]MCI6464979.1 nickel pincer cofactor biosynthesis protein LarC [Faecalicatena sp.]MDY5617190.1 nickel pincer cofactor biosynthesis protein LarC [Lachnospiraceae bacterium]
MSRTLYLECGAGISGDMMAAALLDLGADEQVLRRTLESLHVPGYQIKISRVSKNGLDACDFNVVLDEKYENHDHDMEYLHGHAHGKDHSHTQKDHASHAHVHEHVHTHDHVHAHRNLGDILSILRSSDMTDHAKHIAVRIFEILAQSEAKAHGVSMEEVHFHEVGAVDSIVDIAAVAVCLDDLGIEEVIVPVLNEGSGYIRCQHGMIPVPVPAVAAIVQEYGLTLHMTGIEGELVTPTGAAIAAAVRTSSRLPEQFIIQKIGIGAGKRQYERPSLLRAMLIEPQGQEEDYDQEDCIYKLETNIDDCTGEALGYVMQRLLDAGARDVHYIPVFMKKNRPAYQLNVICMREDVEKLEEIIFKETTTIGIRRQRMERSVLKRELKEVETSLGTARVKVCSLPSGNRIYPEYDSVVQLSEKNRLSWQDVYRLIEREAHERDI